MSLGFIKTPVVNRMKISTQQNNVEADTSLKNHENLFSEQSTKSWSVFHFMIIITCIEITCVSIPLIISAIQLT